MTLKHRMIWNLLFQRDTGKTGIVMTTSLIVSKRFGKEPFSIGRKISDLRFDKAYKKHFLLVEYINESGDYRDLYLMDKKGVALLSDMFDHENDPLVGVKGFLNGFDAEEQRRVESKQIMADIRGAVKRGDRGGLFFHKGVFKALKFALHNPGDLGIDKQSREYCQIKCAYWGMPWALKGFNKTYTTNWK